MRQTGNKAMLKIAAWLCGTTFILGGCDPTLQATVEDGIIASATSFTTSFMAALIQVLTEARNAGTI